MDETHFYDLWWLLGGSNRAKICRASGSERGWSQAGSRRLAQLLLRPIPWGCFNQEMGYKSKWNLVLVSPIHLEIKWHISRMDKWKITHTRILQTSTEITNFGASTEMIHLLGIYIYNICNRIYCCIYLLYITHSYIYIYMLYYIYMYIHNIIEFHEVLGFWDFYGILGFKVKMHHFEQPARRRVVRKSVECCDFCWISGPQV